MARMSSPELSSALSPDVAQRLKRDEAGLVAAIIQDDTNGDVLMLGWMDDEALRRTLSEGRVTFWSRSRGEYWRKGDTSGHAQYVRSVALDCDGDALLVRVDQVGAACHTGERSCFFTDLDAAVCSDGAIASTGTDADAATTAPTGTDAADAATTTSTPTVAADVPATMPTPRSNA